MACENQESTNAKGLKCKLEKIVNVVGNLPSEAKKLGAEDPRRIIHSIKVGLAICAVSLFYYFDFSYEGFGVNAMWAVMTVVVVFEFSVGATLGKGVNRAIATLLGGSLGVGGHRIASFTGEKVECFVLGSLVFLFASITTFVRFFPKLKARYDYALLIFILTFSLISVSGYRDDEVVDMAHRRLSTILIGGAATVFVCIFICPIWAGTDLHNLTASNIEKLGIFLEGFGHEYFKIESAGKEENKAGMDEYKSVLNSKGTEESLVNFAKWEPRHGKFRYRHPWDQYLKIGALTRECAYRIDALNSYLNSGTQTPLEVRSKIREQCMTMSSECSYALKELAKGIKTMKSALQADQHILNAKTASKRLKSSLNYGLWPETEFLEVVQVITVASLLIEIVSCTLKIADSVHELASLSKFEIPDLDSMSSKSVVNGRVLRTPSIESHNFGIVLE